MVSCSDASGKPPGAARRVQPGTAVEVGRRWSGPGQAMASGHERPADPGGAPGLPGEVKRLPVLPPLLLEAQSRLSALGGRPGPRAEVRQPLEDPYRGEFILLQPM